MTALRYGISDTLVLAKRSLLRIPRQPDLLVGFTVQPILFVLLFVYVFGGAIQTPGFDYVDFLMPGIIVQSIAFGGFVTALGLADDLKKGLMDRFRSLPMTRSALLTGRTLGDVGTNIFQLVVMFTVGLLIGFNFSGSVGEVIAGIALILLIAYTIQPVRFVQLFVDVFGGAIQTPGFDYVDFLMPGIIVQSLAFGGFVTALGLSLIHI